MARLKTLKQYLMWYYDKVQKDILVVYRGSQKETWAKRAMFLSPKYCASIPYNHRSILLPEIIIEYDEDVPNLNERLAEKVCAKLKKDKIAHAKWRSGNKSVHIHTLLLLGSARNIPLLKKVFMRYYGTFWYNTETGILYENEQKGDKYKKIIPDLRLADNGHLIRAEYGVHEKTSKAKTLINTTLNYPSISIIPEVVWEIYFKEFRTVIARRVTIDVKDVENHELVQKILDTSKFREDIGDGRERVMFALIHILKNKYPDKEDMTRYLWEWYRYSGGTKMAEVDVRNKVRYHFNKNYTVGVAYLQRIIDEVCV